MEKARPLANASLSQNDANNEILVKKTVSCRKENCIFFFWLRTTIFQNFTAL